MTVISVLENMTMPCAIHIAFNGTLPEDEEARFTQIAKKYQVPFCIYWIDDSTIQHLNSNSYITITAYYSLLQIVDALYYERHWHRKMPLFRYGYFMCS